MPSLPRTTLAIAALVLIGACSSGETRGASADAAGGTLIVTPVNDAVTVFPPLVGELTGKMVQDLVFDRLAEIDSALTTTDDRSFSPRLAKTWTWAPDSMSIAFTLDPRARWHDGAPVTASDVRYSFRAFMDPKVGSPTAPTLSNIDSVSVRDSATAVVWFKRRSPEQFYDVAYQLVIIPEHVYGKIPFDQLEHSDAIKTPIGTGRFRFVKWEPGVRMELVADTANFRGRAKLDRILIVPAIPPTGAVQVLTGQSDFQDAFPGDQLAALDSSKVARPLIARNLAYVFMGMNRSDPKSPKNAHPIFSDVRVRRALSMAVDREAMLRNEFGANGRLSHGPFNMNVPFADSAVHPLPFDTTAARALLDSAGWRAGPDGIRVKNGRPLRFSLLVSTTSVPRQHYAQMIQAALKKVGAQADIDLGDMRAVGERMAKHDWDAIMGGFSTDPSPTGAKQNWGTEGMGPSGQNFMNYSNPMVDALLDSAAKSFDPTKTKAYSARAFRAIIADAPAIFLYDMVLTYAVNRRVNVGPMRADAWWANLADWTIAPDRRIDRDRIGLTPAKP